MCAGKCCSPPKILVFLCLCNSLHMEDVYTCSPSRIIIQGWYISLSCQDRSQTHLHFEDAINPGSQQRMLAATYINCTNTFLVQTPSWNLAVGIKYCVHSSTGISIYSVVDFFIHAICMAELFKIHAPWDTSSLKQSTENKGSTNITTKPFLPQTALKRFVTTFLIKVQILELVIICVHIILK